jgi:hypothetical protein
LAQRPSLAITAGAEQQQYNDRHLPGGDSDEHSQKDCVGPPHDAARAVNFRLLLGGVVQLDEKSGRLLHHLDR